MKASYFCAPVLAVLLLAGCSSSPVDYQKRSSLSSATVLGLSTAGGAVAGSELTKSKWGAPAGAVAGLAAGVVTNKLLDSGTDRIRAESYEQGKRDARVSVLKEIYEKQAIFSDPLAEQQTLSGVPTFQDAGERVIDYEAGVYSGVRMLNHYGSAPGVDDSKTRQ